MPLFSRKIAADGELQDSVDHGIVDLRMKATNLHKRKRSKKVSPLKSKFPLKMDSFDDKSPVVLSELSKSVNETDRDQSSFHQ